MASTIIKTVGCPLDHDLLKSWEHFSLESSHDSDDSETTDEETIINQDDWVKQFSFDAVSDSKYTFSECLDKITEANPLNKNNSERYFTKDKANEKNISMKNKESLNFVLETDVKSTFSKHSNKTDESNFQDKDDTKELTFVNDTEDIEKLFSSLSLKNNELLNKNNENDSDTSAGYESNSDSDDQDESAALKERAPQRHNRPENNKQLRITPFPQNRARFCRQHLNSENSQTLNIYPMYDNFNIIYDGCDSLNNINSANFEEYAASSSIRTFHSGFSNSEPATELFENNISSRVADQIVNNVIPYRVTNEINDGIIPCEVTNQVINGIIPCPFMDEMFDSVVPSPNDMFSAEINNISNCNNLGETFFSESNDSSCTASDGERETILDFHFEDLSPEEVDQMLKEFIKLKTNSSSNQSCGNLSQHFQLRELSSNEVENILNNSLKFNQNNALSLKGNNFSKRRQQNFDTEVEHAHSFCSKENLRATSRHLYLTKRNNVSEKPSKFHVSKSGNYSNLIAENIPSINNECSSHKTSDFDNVSEEIEHKIVKYKEERKKAMKGQEHLSLLSDPATELNWDVFPFVEVDDNSILECVNTLPNISQNKISGKRKNSKKKSIKQAQNSLSKVEQPKICCMIKTVARNKLFQSASFCNKKLNREIVEISEKIRCGLLRNGEKKIIHYLNKNRETKYKGTNLHQAIQSDNIEKVFCIVEYHKMYHETIPEINLRDSDRKTVLDYSKEKGLDLLTDYLRENNATESVNV